jgi:hypothetical protein
MRLPFASSSAAVLAGLALAITACGTSSTGDSSREHGETLGQTSSAIINGTLDTLHPAVVALILSEGSVGGLCSGTIVKTDPTHHIGWVVTAAHCVKLPPSVAIQASNIQSTTALHYDVIDFAADPRWTGATDSDYDFAVVRIAGIDATTPTLPLTTADDGLSTGSSVQSVGFGRTTLMSSMSANTNTQRYIVTKTLNTLSASHMGFDMADNGICQGDSGGPVIGGSFNDERVVGVHSYVEGDCNGEGASSRVTLALDSFFLPELEKALPDESCGLCEKTANSGKNDCAAISASCLSDPNCKGYFECLSEKTKADCIKEYPLAEVPFYAAANCICSGACKDSCATDTTCANVPKCGYANPRGDCATCIEGSCCAEETACAANGQCYVCLKNGDTDPDCATNEARMNLAMCAANQCTTQCKGASIQSLGNRTDSANSDIAPALPPTTVITHSCAFSSSSPSSPSPRGGDLGTVAVVALAAIASAMRRRRRRTNENRACIDDR